MKFLFPAIFLVTAVTFTMALTLDKGHRLPKDFDFKTLSHWNKLKLFLTNKFSPSSFNNLPTNTFEDILEYLNYPSIDNSFVDARTLFTQVKKISSNAQLPEINWGYSFDFCFFFWCWNMDVAYSTKDTKFVGSETITSKTEITPTTITNTFKIPSFNWTSPGFLVNVTDYLAQRIHLTRSSFYSFENTTISFTLDYNFVPDVGIQVDNLSIYYHAGKVRGGVEELTIWDFEGNLLECHITDPEDFIIDSFMMDNWNWAKREYTKHMQYSMNCFFSNGRSDPEYCLYGDNDDKIDDVRRDYFKMVNVQLFQTLGLGALLE